MFNEIRKEHLNCKSLLNYDKVRLSSWLTKIERIKDTKLQSEKFSSFKKQLELALLRKEKHLVKPRIMFPSNLPITSKIDEFKELVKENQVVIVSGTTGSGKTTQIPKALLDLGIAENGVIGCTQPRRIAATGMARRVAEEMNCTYGKEVGCQIRFDKRVSDDTLVKFMTDGVLLAESTKDKLLLQYSAIIIDEVHERSLNIDFILGYIKQLLEKRKDLKIIISSATLDSELYSEFFNNAPVVEVEGKTFPVEDIFLAPYEDEELSQHCSRAVEWITDLDSEGDILIFMPGEREIKDIVNVLTGKKYKNTSILPLYGRISIAEQQSVFKKESNRRIIVSTNVAETSITIPGIHYVIDSGLARVSRYIPKTQIQMLQVEQISQASAKQRRGRCGRVSEGICIYLYDKLTLEEAPEYTDPEICRTSLSGVILQMKSLNLPDIEEFPFLDAPSIPLIREGKKSLREILALDARNELTNEGKLISRFPIEARFAKMIVEANKRDTLCEVIAIASFLSIQDPKERPEADRAAADQCHEGWQSNESDFESIIHLWNFLITERNKGLSNTQFRKLCKSNFLNNKRVREWFNLYQDLANIAIDLKWISKSKFDTFYNYDYDKLHMSLLAGFPTNIGQKQEDKSYRSTNSRKFFIFPGSCLAKVQPQWTMTFPLVETSRLFGRNVAKIKVDWLDKIAPHLCKKKHFNPQWDAYKGFVYAQETVSFYGIVVKDSVRVHYGSVNPKNAREIFIEDGVIPGDIRLQNKWIKRHRKLIKQIRILEDKIRRPDALMDLEAMYNHFDKMIPQNIHSARDFDRWLHKSKTNIDIKFEDAVFPELSDINLDNYPDAVKINGYEFKLGYNFDPGEKFDGVTLYTKEENLSLIPEWTTEWAIPGYLEEKITLIIKTLPKSIKVSLFPLKRVISDFIDKVNSGELIKDQNLLNAISTYIYDEYDILVGTGDFNIDNLPEYLTMNIAILDDNTGKIKSIERGFDSSTISTIKKVYSTEVGIDKWRQTGLTSWPGSDLPKSMTENNKVCYPSLVDEGATIGIKTFINEDEAEFHHSHGLARLFILNNKDHCKFVERKLPLSNNLKMSLSQAYSSNEYKQDIITAAIRGLYSGINGKITTKYAFEDSLDTIKGGLFYEIDVMLRNLEKAMKDRDDINYLLLKYSNSSRVILDDIDEQLKSLLSNHFLKIPYVYSRYGRYFKALTSRINRLNFASDKDLIKINDIEEYQTKLSKIINNNIDISSSYSLGKAFIALQEFRIKTFTTEVKPHEKVSKKQLDEMFKNI